LVAFNKPLAPYSSSVLKKLDRDRVLGTLSIQMETMRSSCVKKYNPVSL
jgi:hypothetical protein